MKRRLSYFLILRKEKNNCKNGRHRSKEQFGIQPLKVKRKT